MFPNCISLFRVSRRVSVSICTNAIGPLSSQEYKNIIRMVEMDVETAEDMERADAERLHPSGTLETVCCAIRDAMGDTGGDWRNYARAAAVALGEMPAIAIEAATAGETGTGSTEGESAGPKDIAQGDAE